VQIPYLNVFAFFLGYTYIAIEMDLCKLELDMTSYGSFTLGQESFVILVKMMGKEGFMRLISNSWRWIPCKSPFLTPVMDAHTRNSQEEMAL